ncbi:hypothetical protein NL676_001253 [Syzygium grande]|nr:hypothetical protein NL676_001253 [Syzygium grande]
MRLLCSRLRRDQLLLLLLLLRRCLPPPPTSAASNASGRRRPSVASTAGAAPPPPARFGRNAVGLGYPRGLARLRGAALRPVRSISVSGGALMIYLKILRSFAASGASGDPHSGCFARVRSSPGGRR